MPDMTYPGQYQQQPYGQPVPPPPPPPAPKKRSVAKVAAGVIVAAVVVLCGVGIIIAAATSKNPSTPTGAATTPAQSGTAGIVGWRAGGGLTLINAMAADFGDISTAGKNTDVTAMHTACTKLQTDVEAAQAYKAIPDDQAQQHWSKALALEARAATDCVAGTSQANATLITQAGQEMDQGASELDLTAARLKVLAG